MSLLTLGTVSGFVGGQGWKVSKAEALSGLNYASRFTVVLFHWQDWFLLNLFECWCESNLIQRNQADKEARRLLSLPRRRISPAHTPRP